ncbi:MAG: type II toxin-antitoxin system RelE/ParE family toxin [Bacteroidota bacterium]
MEIKWTVKAKQDYDSILDYILSDFSIKEVEKFVNLTEDTLFLISKNPLMFPKTKTKNVRKCVLVQQVNIYYRVNKNQIEVLTFWDNRRNPKGLKH